MTVKEWLNRGYKLDTEIDALLEEQRMAWVKATGTTVINTDDKVQTSKQNTTENRFISYLAYSALIDTRIDELYSVKNEISQAIESVDDAVLRTLLMLRYIRFYTWEQIAEKMNYDVRYIYKLHRKALQFVKNKIGH